MGHVTLVTALVLGFHTVGRTYTSSLRFTISLLKKTGIFYNSTRDIPTSVLNQAVYWPVSVTFAISLQKIGQIQKKKNENEESIASIIQIYA